MEFETTACASFPSYLDQRNQPDQVENVATTKLLVGAYCRPLAAHPIYAGSNEKASSTGFSRRSYSANDI